MVELGEGPSARELAGDPAGDALELVVGGAEHAPTRCRRETGMGRARASERDRLFGAWRTKWAAASIRNSLLKESGGFSVLEPAEEADLKLEFWPRWPQN